MRDGPPRREARGHGRLIVVVGVTPHQGAEESSAQGEGAEVSVAERPAGVRDARCPVGLSASRLRGDQARESRVLGNGHALFGEGRTEKDWQQHLAGRLLYVVITGATKELLEQEVKPIVVAFLRERGLELSQEKTVITHIADGFDFLGQNVRKYNGKLLIKPSAKSILSVLGKVRTLIKDNKSATAGTLICHLNPLIRGWAMYHRHVVHLRNKRKALLPPPQAPRLG